MASSKILFLISITLILSLTVSAASSNDFVKIDLGNDVNAFTHKDLKDNRFVVASDNIFYGSNNGQITMTLYLADKIASGNYKFGLETRSKSITVKSVGVDKSPVPVLAAANTKYDYPNIISLDANTTEVNVVIEFNPSEIGLLEEFDVILYDDKGNPLVTYDPFISGFNFRQKLTLNTDGIGLGGNITNDHTILAYLDPTNTDFWTGDVLGTGNGITFAGSDEVTELDFDIEDFNNTDTNAWFWVEYTETFTSATDVEAWIYYGGADVNNSDGTAAYPADYKLVYHSTIYEGGTNLPEATGTDDITLNSTGEGQFGKIAGSVNYQSNNYGDSGDTGSTPTDFTAMAWVNIEASGASDTVLGLGTAAEALQRRETNPCANRLNFRATDALCNDAATVVENTWMHTAVTYVDGSNTKTIYTNATDSNTAVDAGLTQSPTFFVSRKGGFTTENMTGRIDEMKLITRVLSDDEITLIYNSENLSLITFGAQETPFEADFLVSLNPNGLDPENGITTVVATLGDNSNPGGTPITDWNYFVDTVQFYHSTVDGNTTRNFTVAGDFNVSLIVTNNAGAFAQKDKTVSIVELPQNIDINFANRTFSTGFADVNFGVTFTGSGTAFNWGFPGDLNQTNKDINKLFTVNGTKTVCVTITSSDANKTGCENFLLGRVLTKIPLDAETFVELTPHDIDARNLPIQNYSDVNNVDANVYFFSDATSFAGSVSVDFNSSYFPVARAFLFNSSFFEFQPYLVANNGTNLEATIFTINNPEGRTNLPGIRIISSTDINGVDTIVESKISDGTGQALFHFVKNQVYRLQFLDSDNNSLFTSTIEANDTQYFAFIDLSATVTAPAPQGTVNVLWSPVIGNVIPVDGNMNVSQIIQPTNFTVGDVNVFVSYLNDTNVFFQQIITVNSALDSNVSFTFPVGNLDSNLTVKIHVQVFDSGGNQIGNDFTKVYGFSDSFNVNVFEDAKEVLGSFVVALIAIFISAFLVAQISVRSLGEDKNGIGIVAIFVTGIFVFVGWIAFDVWAAATFLGLGAFLFGVNK